MGEREGEGDLQMEAGTGKKEEDGMTRSKRTRVVNRLNIVAAGPG